MPQKSAVILQDTWNDLRKNGWNSDAQKYYEKKYFQPILDQVTVIEKEIERFDAEIEEQLRFLAKMKNNDLIPKK